MLFCFVLCCRLFLFLKKAQHTAELAELDLQLEREYLEGVRRATELTTQAQRDAEQAADEQLLKDLARHDEVRR